MTTPAPQKPLVDCSPSQVGPCVKCFQATCRYGSNGNPLCPTCRGPVLEQARKKRKM